MVNAVDRVAASRSNGAKQRAKRHPCIFDSTLPRHQRLEYTCRLPEIPSLVLEISNFSSRDLFGNLTTCYGMLETVTKDSR